MDISLPRQTSPAGVGMINPKDHPRLDTAIGNMALRFKRGPFTRLDELNFSFQQVMRHTGVSTEESKAKVRRYLKSLLATASVIQSELGYGEQGDDLSVVSRAEYDAMIEVARRHNEAVNELKSELAAVKASSAEQQARADKAASLLVEEANKEAEKAKAELQAHIDKLVDKVNALQLREVALTSELNDAQKCAGNRQELQTCLATLNATMRKFDGIKLFATEANDLIQKELDRHQPFPVSEEQPDPFDEELETALLESEPSPAPPPPPSAEECAKILAKKQTQGS